MPAATAPRPPTIFWKSSSATANGTEDGARKQLVQFFEAWGRREATVMAASGYRPFFLITISRIRTGITNADQCRLSGPGDLPAVIPVFPCRARCCCRAPDAAQHFRAALPAMVDDALRDGHRLIGMIQPDLSHSRDEARPALFRVGCVEHHPARRSRRRPLHPRTHRHRTLQDRGRDAGADCVSSVQGGLFPLHRRFHARKGEEAVDREALLEVLTDFLKANNLKVDWEGVESAPNEALVNALAMMSPYGSPEKQAMLEAPDLKTRAEILIAVTEMDLAKKRTSSEPGLQ